MRILVTGGNGFFAHHLIESGLMAGHRVDVLIRPGSEPWRLKKFEDRVEILPVDLNDHGGVRETVARGKPDVVAHLAWEGVDNRLRNDAIQTANNRNAAINLLEAVAESGARKWIGLGSQAEYGPLDRRITEDDALRPSTLYGAAKVETGALAHRTAAELNISFAWLRLFSAYGPYDNPGWLIPSLILKMMQGERPQCTEGTQLWDYLYIKDAALAALAVMETPRATGFFNLASGAPVRIKDIVVKLRDMIAPGMDLQFGEVPFRPDQIMHMEGDPSRLTASTGWTPATTLDQGLEETWAWFRDHAQEYD